MVKKTCGVCGRVFKNTEGLIAHNNAKHSEILPKDKKRLPVKKMRNLTIFIVVIGLIIFGVIALIPERNVKDLNVDLGGREITIPSGAVHWHPRITIKVDGETIPISTDIGLSVGKIVDTSLSGMRMSPTHTHETDGTIHLENNNPSSKPETLTLGYFFYVWDKQFSSKCIFEYCTDNGELKMHVNGVENNEFENYVMKDKDEILIEYTSR
ncbi:hypothetical protein COU60_02515 [Candidatus Pacearchaeota archaeon CG10_big_fil_rev_8_21_14_0_10_34_76]|nr:MAG: hypothetical protein COU60_02515 [Candidatus Pacearchaeota archaeon CG10_big_fil_rev_8_21_14_0_10_34_76]